MTIKNLLFPIKVAVSLIGAYRILRQFKPDVVAGFGGYASGAAVWVAAKLGIPTLIMEQNSYPGMTNRLLNGKAATACLAYEESREYFDKCHVVITGNPIRAAISEPEDRDGSVDRLGLDKDKRTILIVGGSLGAGSLNKAIAVSGELLADRTDVQIIWQCGGGYYEMYKECAVASLSHVYLSAFIEDMAVAYGAADLVICRAGALTVAEVMHLGKAAILVPSPNVAEDHQTKNAQAVVDHEAGLLLADKDVDQVMKIALELLDDKTQLEKMSANIKSLAKPNAVVDIADEVMALIRK